MKISLSTKDRRNERGSAVAVVLTMLGIMLICVSVNLVAVRNVDRELKLLDKRQTQRLRHNAPIQATAAKDSSPLTATEPTPP